MSFLAKLQAKPQKEKVRIIWLTAAVVAVILFVVWIFTSRIAKNHPPDTTLFRTMGKGIKDIKDNFRK